jgi:hypothetical protein
VAYVQKVLKNQTKDGDWLRQFLSSGFLGVARKLTFWWVAASFAALDT